MKLKFEQNYFMKMSCLILSTVAIQLTSFSVRAADVIPSDNFGTLRLTLPQDSRIPKDLAEKTFFSFKIATTTPLGPNDFVYNGIQAQIGDVRVPVGTGCLFIEDKALMGVGNGYKNWFQVCGIEIKKNQITTQELSVVNILIDWNKLKTDVGPTPTFTFWTDSLNKRLDIDSVKNAGPRIAPEIQVNASLADPSMGLLWQRSFKVEKNAYHVLDFALPEMRATVQVDFADGAPKLPVKYGSGRPGTAFSNRLSLQFGSYAKNESKDLSSTDILQGYFKNELDFPMDGRSITYKVFPVKQDASWKNGNGKIVPVRYDLKINGLLVTLSNLISNKVTSVPVATLNVYSFHQNIPGTFEVTYSNDNSESKNLLNLLDFEVCQSQYSCSRTAEEMATQVSLFVPYGYKYDFKFYEKDLAGARLFQDQAQVDLTQYPQ